MKKNIKVEHEKEITICDECEKEIVEASSYDPGKYANYGQYDFHHVCVPNVIERGVK